MIWKIQILFLTIYCRFLTCVDSEPQLSIQPEVCGNEGNLGAFLVTIMWLQDGICQKCTDVLGGKWLD